MPWGRAVRALPGAAARVGTGPPDPALTGGENTGAGARPAAAPLAWQPAGLPILGLIAVLVAAVAPYLNALDAFWVGDDYNYVVPKSLAAVLNFFNPLGRAQFRPFNWLSWELDWLLFGPAPLGWHLTQLAMHVACTLLVVLLLAELARGWWPADAGMRRWVPLVAGALFAVNPTHPEAVTWIGGRADVPFALGLFLAALALARWRTSGRRKASFYALAWLGTWLSIMGKEAGLITPLALLLVDLAIPDPEAAPLFAGARLRPVAPGDLRSLGVALAGVLLRVGLFLGLLALLVAALGQAAGVAAPFLLLLAGLPVGRGILPAGRVARLARDHVPFLAVAAAYAALRIGLFLLGQGRLMYGVGTQLQFGPETLLNAAAGYLAAGLGAWEAPESIATWPLPARLALVLAALLVAGFAVRRLGRPALFAVAWIPATLLVTFDAAADRWLYVPSLGLCLLAAALCARAGRRQPLARVLPALALGLLWGALTVDVNARWVESGRVAQGILQQIRSLVPDPPRPATFYLANPPYSYRGVLLFNSGFAVAPSFAYQDYRQITGYELQEHAAQIAAALANPARVGPHPVFLRYEAGRMVPYPSLAALVAAQGGP